VVDVSCIEFINSWTRSRETGKRISTVKVWCDVMHSSLVKVYLPECNVLHSQRREDLSLTNPMYFYARQYDTQDAHLTSARIIELYIKLSFADRGCRMVSATDPHSR
jgi:hypothetical protein